MLFKTSIKKCFILTALLMLLTGCTINYNLTIDNNSVSESISGSVDKNEYELEDGDTGLNLFYTLIKKDVPALVSGDSLYNKDITETDDGINYNYTYIIRCPAAFINRFMIAYPKSSLLKLSEKIYSISS